MEEKKLKNENNTTVTLDSLENNKREDEDIKLAPQNNGDKEIQGVKSISLGKSLLGDNTLKKGISVSVRGRNAGSVLNLKNGGSVWKKKDEKGLENQREEIGKKIDEESFPDLLESTEKIKSELSKDKDKRKKGGKELKKQDDGSFRCGSEKGKGESVSGEKRRPFTNNLEASQNNDIGLKKWSDQVNDNETTDVKENEHVSDEKQDADNVGYLMPGFKGKHMIGFYCFLKKGNQNPPPLPPKVPFDDTSFFEIIEKQKNLMIKPVAVPVISASHQMVQLGQGNQMSQVMHTPSMANMQSTNCINNGSMGMGGGNNQNQMNPVNKINAFNSNDKVIRKQQDVGQNRFIQNPQIANLSRSNLNMFDENANNISGNSSINNVSRSNNYSNRGARSIGQNNMNYGMNSTNDAMKNNMLNSGNNYIKGSNNAGNPSGGGSARQRNFNRRNEKKDDKKVKIADIDADTNWRSPLNKKVDYEKTAEVSNDMWNGSVDNNANSVNYNNDNNSNSNNNNINNNNDNNSNSNNNNNNISNNNNSNSNNMYNTNVVGNDRMKRGFRNRNINAVGNMSSVGSASSFNRSNFNTNRSFFNRNSTNSNVMNRSNLHKNNNMNSGNNNFVNNNNMQMNVSRNNMYRGNGNRNNASVLNNNNYANYNNMGNNKNMNRNFVKRNNMSSVQNFGNNDSGNNGGVLANNLFNRLSGNIFQITSLTPRTASHTSPSNRRAANIEQDNSANVTSGAAVTDRGNDLNVEIGNN